MVVTNVLYDLVAPLVENKTVLKVKELESLNENEVILVIYATSEDVGRLIGKKGAMASSLRQVMTIASRLIDKKIIVKFEAI